MGPPGAQRHKKGTGVEEAADDDPHGVSGTLSAKLDALPAEQPLHSARPSPPPSKLAAAPGPAKQSKGRSGASRRGKKRSADQPAKSVQVERKRQNVLLKNRQSAAAFRERLKQYTQDLEHREEELLLERSLLKSSLAQSQQSTDLLRSNSASMAGLPRSASLDLPRTACLPTEGCTTLLGPRLSQGLGAAAAGALVPAQAGWQQHLLRRQQQQRQDALARGQEGGEEEGEDEEEEDEEGQPVAVLPAPATGLQLLFPRQLLQGRQQTGQPQRGLQLPQGRHQPTRPASFDPGASPFAQPSIQEAAQREASPGAVSPTYGPLGLSRLESAGSMPGAAPAYEGCTLPGEEVLQGLSQAVAGVVQAALASGRVQELPPLLRVLAEGVVQEKLSQLKAGHPGSSHLEQHLMAAAAGHTPPAVPALPCPCLPVPSTAAAELAGAGVPFLGLGLKAPPAMAPWASQPFSSSGAGWQLQSQQSSGVRERVAATAGPLSVSGSGGGAAGTLPFLPHMLAPSLGTSSMATAGLGSGSALKRDPSQPGWQRQAALQFIPTADPFPPSAFEDIAAEHTGPTRAPLAPTAPLMPAALGCSASNDLPAASPSPPAGVVRDAGSDATVELPTLPANVQLAALHAMDTHMSPRQHHHASPQTPALHLGGIAQQAQQAQRAQQRQRQQELLGHIRQLTPQQFKAKMGTLTSQQQEAVKGIIVRRKLARGHGGQQGQQGAVPVPQMPGAANTAAGVLHSLGASSSGITSFRLPASADSQPVALAPSGLANVSPAGQASALGSHQRQHQQQEQQKEQQQQQVEQGRQQEQGQPPHWLTFPSLPLQPQRSGEGLSVQLLPAAAADRCGSGLTWLELRDAGDGDDLLSRMELQRCWSPSDIMTP